MSTNLATLSCAICNERAAETRWLRQLPGLLRVGLCQSCATEWIRRADDRAFQPEDRVRLAGLYSVLAGEVWEDPAGLAWFQTPLRLRDRVQADAADVKRVTRTPKAVLAGSSPRRR